MIRREVIQLHLRYYRDLSNPVLHQCHQLQLQPLNLVGTSAFFPLMKIVLQRQPDNNVRLGLDKQKRKVGELSTEVYHQSIAKANVAVAQAMVRATIASDTI